MLGGFKISCNYCGNKASIKTMEQYNDMKQLKKTAGFHIVKGEIKCWKCGNKVTEQKVNEKAG